MSEMRGELMIRVLAEARRNRPRNRFSPLEKRHQLWVRGEMLVDEVEQLQEPLHRVDPVDLETHLFLAQLSDHVLEHGDVEPALVAEVVIDHPGVGARALADSLDARTAETVGRKLADGGAEDLLPGPVCVPLSAVHRYQNTCPLRVRCYADVSRM